MTADEYSEYSVCAESAPGTCDLYSPSGRNAHNCMHDPDHTGPHECLCGRRWSEGDDDA